MIVKLCLASLVQKWIGKKIDYQPNSSFTIQTSSKLAVVERVFGLDRGITFSLIRLFTFNSILLLQMKREHKCVYLRRERRGKQALMIQMQKKVMSMQKKEYYVSHSLSGIGETMIRSARSFILLDKEIPLLSNEKGEEFS